MRIEKYYIAGSGEVVEIDGVTAWRLTSPCGHRHGREGAIACALRRGEPIIAEFTERTTYDDDANLLVERALTGIEEVGDGSAFDGAQSPLPDYVIDASDRGCAITDEEEDAILARLADDIREGRV